MRQSLFCNGPAFAEYIVRMAGFRLGLSLANGTTHDAKIIVGVFASLMVPPGTSMFQTRSVIQHICSFRKFAVPKTETMYRSQLRGLLEILPSHQSTRKTG